MIGHRGQCSKPVQRPRGSSSLRRKWIKCVFGVGVIAPQKNTHRQGYRFSLVGEGGEKKSTLSTSYGLMQGIGSRGAVGLGL